MDSSGDLYGATPNGGAYGRGTIFELAHGSHTITTLASFDVGGGPYPDAGVIMDSSGNLYGTTYNGGASHVGTVYELANGSQTITALASFNGTNGANPEAGVIMDSSGNLYGTTFYGGASGYGTVFELAKGSQTITRLASFNDINGANPGAVVIMDGSGNLYGTTVFGDPGDGNLFELPHGSGTITSLASFNGTDGKNPLAGVIMDGSGNLYGTTLYGGASDDGTLFELPHGSGTISALASFDGTNGDQPEGGVIMDGSGNLYGTASGGGTWGSGTVFEFTDAIPTMLAVTGEPPSPIALGSSFGMQVSAEYGDDTVDTSYTGPITLTLGEHPAGGTLGGTVVVAASNGVATFTGLTLSVPGDYTIVASASGLTSATTTTVTVDKITPTITWAGPADITYGTALGTAQLDATASVPGQFTYTPPAGTILGAGDGQALTVTFTPTDGTDYTTATATVTINVDQAASQASANPVNLTYGTSLADGQLSGTATWTVGGTVVTVLGSWSFTSALGTVLHVGAGQSESATFTPTDSTDYLTVTITVIINVAQVAPQVSVSPVNLTYGTPLANGQLSFPATWTVGGTVVAVPGSWSYASALGTVLHPGAGQTESAIFTPDGTDYLAVTITVIINVAQAAPVESVNPVNLTYGTPLVDGQLSGTATWVVGGTVIAVPGSWSFTSALGTVLKAGAGQTESVTFTPTDGTDYLSVTITVIINVAQAAPVVSVNPIDLTYGTPLANGQLSGPATWTKGGTVVAVPGSWSFTSALGTVLKAGAGQSESVRFTPSDGTDYLTVTITVIINMAQATPHVSANPVILTYGTPLADSQLAFPVTWTVGGAVDPVLGSWSYTSALGTVLKAGAGQREPVIFTPTDGTDYLTVTITVTINVLKANQTITWAKPAGITYGTPLGATQLDATVSVAGPDPTTGTLAYSLPRGMVLNAGEGQVLTVTAAATANYNAATVSVTINVLKANQSITWAKPADITYGTPLGATQLDATARVAGPDPTTGTLTYSPPPGTVLSGGEGQVLSVTAAATENYNAATASVIINVRPVPTSTSLVLTKQREKRTLEYFMTALVTGPVPGIPPATGVVVFKKNGAIIGTFALSGGVARVDIGRTAPKTGTFSATFLGNGSLAPSNSIVLSYGKKRR
jgi:uncharacterized repeat protein (TIGR03803 family)